jgi:hypothetical protein
MQILRRYISDYDKLLEQTLNSSNEFCINWKK